MVEEKLDIWRREEFVFKMKSSTNHELVPLHCSSLKRLSQNIYTVIDIRPKSDYDTGHITSAINIHCSPLLIRRFQRGNQSLDNLFLPEEIRRKLQRDSSQIIVLCDYDSMEGTVSKEVRQFARVFQNGKRPRSVFFLDGGIKQFSSEHPQLCESTPLILQTDGKISEAIRDPTDHVLFCSLETEPVRLLPYLFIGSAQHAENREVLQRLGITAIMNVSKTCRNNFEDLFTYKTIPVDDSYNEDIGCYFIDSSNFIESIRRQNGKVLVHCKAGISRSATICLAYLISAHGLSLDEAYEFIKKKKSHISPNFNFLGQLLRFESDKKTARRSKLKLAEAPFFGTELPASPRLPLEKLHQNSPLTTKQTFTYPTEQTASCMGSFFVNKNSLGTNSPTLLPTPT